MEHDAGHKTRFGNAESKGHYVNLHGPWINAPAAETAPPTRENESEPVSCSHAMEYKVGRDLKQRISVIANTAHTG
jgi:hypothetical protein